MKTITVDVTKADISHGVVGDCKLCPVALAVTRVVSPRTDVTVVHNEVFLINPFNGGFQVFPLPKEACFFILLFDKIFDEKTPTPQPITFTLEVPDYYCA